MERCTWPANTARKGGATTSPFAYMPMKRLDQPPCDRADLTIADGAAVDLCHRIFTEFNYDKEATSISTPAEEVLLARKGVCQDFAHVMIGCMRSMGLPARYVSGYLRSGPKMVGSEASHAWVSAYCSGIGWLDFDPTNNVMPSGSHLTVAWGRDYGDVSPVKGVAIGGGEQTITVSVAVVPTLE